MVTINLTILIELILFLVFLWGTQRFILRPILASMDERNDSVVCDLQKAKNDDKRSVELEKEYNHDIAVIRRNADEEIRKVKQKSLQEHADFLNAERQRAEKVVAEVRATAMAHVDSQREAVLAHADELAELMEAQITVSAQPSSGGGQQ
jgi:F-type H+-transporting ATPase subunit b